MTNVGRILQSYKQTITVKYSGYHAEILGVGINENIAEIRLDLNKIDEIKIRKNYYSFFGVIAFMGGLVKAVSFILLAIVFPIREIIYFKTLINTNFNVCQSVEDLTKALGVASEDSKLDPEKNLSLIKATMT